MNKKFSKKAKTPGYRSIVFYLRIQVAADPDYSVPLGDVNDKSKVSVSEARKILRVAARLEAF